jgi:hypothetical protein
MIAVLSSIIAHNLHSEAPRNDLTFVTIPEFGGGVMVNLPPLRPSRRELWLVSDGAQSGMGSAKWVLEDAGTTGGRIQDIVDVIHAIHICFALLSQPCVRAAKGSLRTRCSARTVVDRGNDEPLGLGVWISRFSFAGECSPQCTRNSW